MLVRLILVWVLIGSWWGTQASELPTIGYISHSLKGQLPPSIYSLIQDPTGYIWIGTEAGLGKYDGQALHIFEQTPDGSRLNVSSLALDGSGDIWAGTWGSGLVRINPITETFTYYTNVAQDERSLSDNRVQCLLLGPNGILWVGTASGGLNRMDTNTGQITRYPIEGGSALAPPRIWSLAKDFSGQIWLGTEKGLQRFDPHSGVCQVFNGWSDKPEQVVRALYVDALAAVWLGTDTGLVRYDPRENSHTFYQPYESKRFHPKQNTVNCFFEDQIGRLWIGFVSGGLSLFDRNKGTFTLVEDRQNPLHDDVRTLFQDNGGNIWVGTRGQGLRIFGNTRRIEHFFHNPVDPDSLSGNRVTSFAEDEQSLWVGTEFGLNQFLKGSNQNQHYYQDPANPSSLPSDGISSLWIDHVGHLWVGTTNGVSYREHDNVFKTFQRDPNRKDSLPNNWVNCLLEDQEFMFWAGTKDGLSYFPRDGSSFTNFGFDPDSPTSLSHSVVLSLAEDAFGQIWVGTQGGLCRMKKDRSGFYRYLSGEDANQLGPVRVFAIEPNKLNADQLFLATDQGFCRFNASSEKVEFFGAKEGLNVQIQGVVQDQKGLLWLRSLDGVVCFDQESQRMVAFNSILGFENHPSLPNSCFLSSEGWLAFGGANGFNKVFPSELESHIIYPTLALSSVKVGNRTLRGPILGNQDLVLAPGENSLEIRYALLEFGGEELLFQYQMEGISPEWSEPSQDMVTLFQRLPVGSYTFRVKGSSDRANYSAPAVLRLSVTENWWKNQHLWFSLSLLAMVLISAWLMVYGKRQWGKRFNDIGARHMEQQNSWQRRLELIATVSDRGWFFIDGTDHIIWANDAARALLGRSEEVVGMNAATLFPGSLSQAGNGTLLVLPSADNQKVQIRVTVGNWPDGSGGYLVFEPTKVHAIPKIGLRPSGPGTDDWFVPSMRPDSPNGMGLGSKILGVDSQLKNRLNLDQWLGSLGFEVISAETGHRAIEVALREHPDLILLSIEYDVEDSLEVLSFLRSGSRKPCWVVAVIPQRFDGDPRLEAFDAVCVRPMRYEQLFTLIQTHISQSKTQELDP